jgi:Rps23 Pro-64 3,4-dihydroxylase Tpa1-like proline 4-hydroxylase
MIRSLDAKSLAESFKNARPFPSICIDDFLDLDAAREVARSYPSFEAARGMGRLFEATHESRKIQVTDSKLFSPATTRLAEALASQEFRDTLSTITGIPNLLWDPTFAGGGMHQTAAHGRLDVHVDFNRLSENGWYRRVNLLLYLNEEWKDEWGGRIELWDKDVKKCYQSYLPALARCVIFETSEISYHGVTALTCPKDVVRRSFAVYYYTKEAPTGVAHEHSTIFRARPDEYLKRFVLVPGGRVMLRAKNAKNALKRQVRDALERVRPGRA